MKDDSDKSWKVKQQLGRKLATLCLDSNTVLYKQWLKGQDNVVADSLSRDNYYLSANTHSRFLQLSVPQQLPKNIRIKPVPKEICSFITSILQQLPETQLQSSQPKPSELALGNIGQLTLVASELAASISKVSIPTIRTSYYQDLPKQLEQVPSLEEIVGIWLRDQSQPPLHMWHRPSGQTTGRTPDWTRMAKHASYCRNNLKDTET